MDLIDLVPIAPASCGAGDRAGQEALLRLPRPEHLVDAAGAESEREPEGLVVVLG